MLNGKHRKHAEDNTKTDEADHKRVKRVCLYCVVSEKSYSDTQEFMNQQLTMVHLINNTPGWHYEKIFMDVKGEHTAFQEMIDACFAGMYDIIVTKSVLRFAGSIEKTLDIAYRLAILESPVEILFTDEAIFSLDKERLKEIKEKLQEIQPK